jgi:hypothetical protein
MVDPVLVAARHDPLPRQHRRYQVDVALGDARTRGVGDRGIIVLVFVPGDDQQAVMRHRPVAVGLNVGAQPGVHREAVIGPGRSGG